MSGIREIHISRLKYARIQNAKVLIGIAKGYKRREKNPQEKMGWGRRKRLGFEPILILSFVRQKLYITSDLNVFAALCSAARRGSKHE
jgi:hypothetical protein